MKEEDWFDKAFGDPIRTPADVQPVFVNECQLTPRYDFKANSPLLGWTSLPIDVETTVIPDTPSEQFKRITSALSHTGDRSRIYTTALIHPVSCDAGEPVPETPMGAGWLNQEFITEYPESYVAELVARHAGGNEPRHVLRLDIVSEPQVATTETGTVPQKFDLAPSSRIGRGLIEPILHYFDSPTQEPIVQTEETKPVMNLFVCRPFSKAAQIAKDQHISDKVPYIDLEQLYRNWVKPAHVAKYPGNSFDSCDGTSAYLWLRYLFSIGEKVVNVILPSTCSIWVEWFVDAVSDYGATTNVIVVVSDIKTSVDGMREFHRSVGLSLSDSAFKDTASILMNRSEVEQLADENPGYDGHLIDLAIEGCQVLIDQLAKYNPKVVNLEKYLSCEASLQEQLK